MVLQTLFDICRSFPVQDGFLNFGHDYGGLAIWDKFHILARPWSEYLVDPLGNASQRAEAAYPTADPLDIGKLRTLIRGDSLDTPAPEDFAPHTHRPVTGLDVFDKVPVEVLQDIFERLHGADVRHLRQASKACANVPLSEPFWKSRFLPGRDFEALFEALSDVIFEERPCKASMRGKWRSLYYKIRSVRDSRELENRVRVWRLASSLWGLMDRVNSTELEGEDIRPDPRAKDGWFDALRWVDSWATLRPMDRPFDSGSRALHYRTLPFQGKAVYVSVSTIIISGRRYISGLRLYPVRKTSFLGYRHPDTEVLLCPKKVRIAGFHLASDERGVRGLAVLSTDGVLSKWAGDHEGIRVRVLVLPPVDAACGSIRHLKGGFDVSFLSSL